MESMYTLVAAAADVMVMTESAKAVATAKEAARVTADADAIKIS